MSKSTDSKNTGGTFVARKKKDKGGDKPQKKINRQKSDTRIQTHTQVSVLNLKETPVTET